MPSFTAKAFTTVSLPNVTASVYFSLFFCRLSSVCRVVYCRSLCCCRHRYLYADFSCVFRGKCYCLGVNFFYLNCLFHLDSLCLYGNICHRNRAVFYAFFYRKSLYYSVFAERYGLCVLFALFCRLSSVCRVIDCGTFRLACHRYLYAGISCVLRGKCYCLGVSFINILCFDFRFAAEKYKPYCHCRKHGKNSRFFHHNFLHKMKLI